LIAVLGGGAFQLQRGGREVVRSPGRHQVKVLGARFGSGRRPAASTPLTPVPSSARPSNLTRGLGSRSDRKASRSPTVFSWATRRPTAVLGAGIP
jgi:hypothetical protein